MAMKNGWIILLFFLFSSIGINQIHACPIDLPVTTVSINGHELIVEWAETPRSRSCGLSKRFFLDENRGMLFIYPADQPLSFWMKDTLIPLSIAFLDASGKIINMEDMSPNQTRERYRSIGPVPFALEVNQGWFRLHGIRVGDRVHIKHLHQRP